MPTLPSFLRTSHPETPADVPDDGFWICRGTLRLGQAEILSNADGESVETGHLDALLAIALRKTLQSGQSRQIIDALRTSRNGDDSLANLQLALAGFSRIPAPQQLSKRVAMANALVADGATADDLIRIFRLDAALDGELDKYDQNEPRVPAHSPDGGQWTDANQSSAGAAFISASTRALAFRAAPLLAPAIPAAALTGLSIIAAAGGVLAIGAVLFVPSPNSVSSSGALPGNAGTTYDYDHDTGVLRVRDSAGGVLAGGHKDKSGVFFDASTGLPFAREVKGALVFDGSAMAEVDVSDDAKADSKAERRSREEEQEPRLCPDPGPDQKGAESASDRAKEYQEQISRMINPHRPLPYGLAMNLVNPFTGRTVHYDECDEKSGTMIEAKGRGYKGVLSFQQGAEKVTRDWLDQSLRNVQAAGTRQVVWYFAEQEAADYARKLFAKNRQGRERIGIRVQPADSP